MVKEKNSDELFQNFLFHTTNNGASLPSADTSVVDADKGTVKADGQQAVEHLRTLMRLILTNSEARKLLSDAGLIGRDLFARGAAKAADSVRPDQEQLARVDDAAPSDEFIGANGERAGPNDPAPPVLTEEQKQQGQQALDTARQARDMKNDAKGQGMDLARDVANSDDMAGTAQRGFQDRANANAERLPDDQRDRAGNVAQGVQGDAQQVCFIVSLCSSSPRSHSDSIHPQLQSEVQNAPDEEKGEVAKQGLKDRLFGIKDKIPQEHRERAHEQKERSKQFLKDEFPEERRDQVRCLVTSSSHHIAQN